MYTRAENYNQIENSIEHIREQVKQHKIDTLLVSTLERLCEDKSEREKLIKELESYGVEIIVAFDD
ncbi:MAG: recombinase family protein [Clostridia bacterium]|nr:recombinase family protein [Clostridia bacterium]